MQSGPEFEFCHDLCFQFEEFLQALSTEYDLPGIYPLVFEVLEMSAEELRKYAGSYLFEDDESWEIEATESALIATADWLYEPIRFLPKSATEFFDATNGTLIEFEVENDEIAGVTFAGFSASRADQD